MVYDTLILTMTRLKNLSINTRTKKKDSFFIQWNLKKNYTLTKCILPLWDGTQDCQRENLHEPNLLLLLKNLQEGYDAVANQPGQTFLDFLQVYPHWLRQHIA